MHGGFVFLFPFHLDWISQVYLPENHARLKAAHTYVSEELRALGIPFVSRGAGFFIWVDLRKVNRVEVWVLKKYQASTCQEKALEGLLRPELLPSSQYLREGTFEEEELLWRQFLDNKVLLSSGKTFECKEPGWFRVVFSDKENRLRLGEHSPPPTSLQHPLGPLLLTPVAPVLTAPPFFSGMQRMRQVLEGQSKVVEDASPCHAQEPHSQPR